MKKMIDVELQNDKLHECWELGAGSWELGAGSWELGAGRKWGGAEVDSNVFEQV
jgi:hypothetical protein